jgi:uncharacterized protein (TIGR03067 family)/uncharacterized repeat protein (TIGR01451 family)
VARKARADAVRRRAKELSAAGRPTADPPDADLRPAIDLEVGRLPAKYRSPIVLCELEGQPIADAARTLGWPQGTVASRLARGRNLLAKRLARQGLAPAGLTAAALAPDAVAGVLQTARQSSPVVNRLADEAVRAMSIGKLKWLASAVACAAVVLAGGFAFRMSAGASTTRPDADPTPKADPPPKVLPAKPPSLLGRWRVNGDRPFKVLEFRQQPEQGLLIAEKADHSANWFTWKVDDEKNPKWMDVWARVPGKSNPNRGIYKFDGERLVICLGAPLRFDGDQQGDNRPTSFDIEGKPGERFLVLDREVVAWGEPLENGLQYGLYPEPNGRTTVQIGETVTFRVYVRNTTNKMVEVSVLRASDTLPGWPVHLRDEKQNAVRVMNPIPPPGGLPASASLRTQLSDYGVAEVGAVSLTFLSPAEVQRERQPIHMMPVAPGKYTIHLGGAKSAWGGGGPTGTVTLTVEAAVGWGPAVNGLRFGLGLGKGQSSRIYVGERARFRVLAQNTSNQPITVGTLQVLHLPLYAEPAFAVSEGKPPAVRFVRGPELRPPPPNLTVPSKQTIELPGEFTFPFLPHPASGETHAVARPARYTLAIAKLDGWVSGHAGYGTGSLHLEVLPGDRPHADSQGIAWGPTVFGLQFGLRFDPPDRSTVEIGKTIDVVVLARNQSDAPLTLEQPEPEFLAQLDQGPDLKDAAYKHIPLTRPPREWRRPIYKKTELPVGATKELFASKWAIHRQRPEGSEPYFLVQPGEYSIWFGHLRVGRKDFPVWSRPTGDLRFTVK